VIFACIEVNHKMCTKPTACIKEIREQSSRIFCEEAHKRCVSVDKNAKKVRNTVYKDKLKQRFIIINILYDVVQSVIK